MPSSHISQTNLTSFSCNSQHYSQDFNLEDLILLEQIGESKATVFLAQTNSGHGYVAVKIFPHRQRQACKLFLNELKFTHLKHPNIISVIHSTRKQPLSLSDDYTINVSLIVMELAPYGDFFDLLLTHKTHLDDKLARTYFHQLINALEHIHDHGVAHQDLKLDNLLLGKDYNLKVTDFDVSWIEGQAITENTGTLYYRAPEVCDKKLKDPKKADIYSAGVILFLFKSGGMLPHTENQLFEGADLQDLLYNNNDLFWNKHCEIQQRTDSYFDADFRALFNGMSQADPTKRYSLEQIKSSKWYQGELYTRKEVIYMMQPNKN